jgi:hypothetical protein
VTIAETKDGGVVNLFSDGKGRANFIASSANGASLDLTSISTRTGSDSISLSTGGTPTLNMDAANKGSLIVTPGGSPSVVQRKPGGARQWILSESQFELYGTKLQLRDYIGYLLQELPDPTKAAEAKAAKKK